MGQDLLAAILRWPEYNFNSIKQFAPLCHKMHGLTTENATTSALLLIRYYMYQHKWHERRRQSRIRSGSYPGAKIYILIPGSLTEVLGAVGLPQYIYAVWEEGIAPREWSSDQVQIGGGFFPGSPPRLSRGCECGCKTLPRLMLQHYSTYSLDGRRKRSRRSKDVLVMVCIKPAVLRNLILYGKLNSRAWQGGCNTCYWGDRFMKKEIYRVRTVGVRDQQYWPHYGRWPP